MTCSFHIVYILQLIGTNLSEASVILTEASCAFPLFPSKLFLKFNVKKGYDHFLPDRLHIIV
jgi:hypothetical protein